MVKKVDMDNSYLDRAWPREGFDSGLVEHSFGCTSRRSQQRQAALQTTEKDEGSVDANRCGRDGWMRDDKSAD